MNTKNYISSLAGAIVLAGSAFAQAPDITKIKADAEAGNAEAQARLAIAYFNGNGVAKDQIQGGNMEKGFSTTAIDRNVRIRDFVRQHERNVANSSEVKSQLARFAKARKVFMSAADEFEKQLTKTEGVLRKNFKDWGEYEALRDGLEDLSDAIELSWLRR